MGDGPGECIGDSGGDSGSHAGKTGWRGRVVVGVAGADVGGESSLDGEGKLKFSNILNGAMKNRVLGDDGGV